jgi:hypothetical protein
MFYGYQTRTVNEVKQNGQINQLTLVRPAYIQARREQNLEKGEIGRVIKRIKENPQLKRFWNMAHNNDLPPKRFPNKECEIAFLLGRRNHEASDLDE